MVAGRGDGKLLSVSPSSLTLAALVGASGCGGGIPLLHPAQTLPLGDVRAATGFSGNIVTAGFANALQSAINEEPSGSGGAPSAPRTDSTYARGALVAASAGPGLAPFVAARVGIGSKVEAGIGYTGRAVRLDLRRSFDLPGRWALSVGAAGSAALYGHQDGTELADVDVGQMHGVGADVPVLLGYQSDADLYLLWFGARGGWEHVDISEVTSEPGATELGPAPIALSATRWWAGGLVGAAVGFRHVHVAMELDVDYASISGSYNQTHAQVAGVMLTPGTALWWKF
jgi:hypothetical protein